MSRINRDKFEQRFYRNLIRMGFKRTEIEEPDKIAGSDKQKEPDFLIRKNKIIFEVKHPEMTRKELEEEIELRKKLEKGKNVSYWRPVKNDSFEDAVHDAEKKFKNYPGFSSCVVYDISDYVIQEPDIQMLLEGVYQIQILKGEKPKIVGRRFVKRALQLGKHDEIGAVILIRKVRHYIIHNLMVKSQRLLPLRFWQNKISSFYCDQFVIFNIPGGQMVLKKLRS